MRRSINVLIASAGIVFFSDPAMAQSAAIPILIDIQPDDEIGPDSEPVVIAAYQPDSKAPLLDRTGRYLEKSARVSNPTMPTPSIIIGFVKAGGETDFGIQTLLPTTVSAFRFAHNDLETRASLRSENPDVFRKLVIGGHIDPPGEPDDALARALQTELQRMNCYRSSFGVDGAWGDGSKSSVAEYFSALGRDPETWPDRSATVELFREILVNEEVKCVVPEVAEARPRTPTKPAPANPKPTPSKPKPTPAKPKPAPPKQTPEKPKIGSAIGVFR